MWNWGFHPLMRGGWVFSGLLLCLFWLAVVAFVAWLIVRLVGSTSRRQADSAPPPQIQQFDPVLDTLRRRLAEGAITPEEFDELRQKLGV